MKIHRWSPWLRRHWTWAPFTLQMISAAVEILWVPTVVISLLLWGADDLKAWIASLA